MTQPDIYDAVTFAIAQSGKPYHAYGDRFGLDYYDCSGLVIRSLYEAHVPLGPGISVVNKTGNTVSLYNWAKGVGGLRSVAEGVKTKGAVMIKGRWWGFGPLGHTSISLGDGREMAAHGSRRGIGITRLDASFYQDAFIIPGVNYHLGPEPVPPPEIRENDMVILPGTARPESRKYRSAAVAPNGQAIFLMNGGKVLGMDAPHSGDPAERRRWYPKNADGSNAATPELPLIGVVKDAKYLIALRLDGGMYLGEIDAS